MNRVFLTSVFALASVTAAWAQEGIETAPVPDPPGLVGKQHGTSPPEWLYGFEIDPERHLLATYDIPDPEQLAAQYRDEKMKWFYPRHEPSLFYPHLDSNLIPLIEYEFGYARNPVMTSQAALAFYTSFVETGSSYDLRGFLNNVNWLVDNQDEFYLRYDFPWTHNGILLEEGWVSAMAQGEALAAVSTAYFLTGEQEYLDVATGIFRTLYSNGESTWSILVDEDGYYWLEEYPNADLCHVLNGILFGLWGLWDYYVITDDPFALELFKAGIRTVTDHYAIWNLPNVNLSRYCLHGLRYPFYHETHLRQFEAYLQYFDIPEFEAAIELFTKEPRVAVSADALQFGNVEVGRSSTRDLVIFNDGIGALDVFAVTTTDSTFTVTFEETTISEGDSAVVQVIFSPLESGPQAATLSIESEGSLAEVSLEGHGIMEQVAAEAEGEFPQSFAIRTIFPNPFSEATRVHIAIPQRAAVRLVVANALGQTVRVLHDGVMHAGIHTMHVDMSGLSAGIYYCRMEAGGFSATRSLVYVR